MKVFVTRKIAEAGFDILQNAGIAIETWEADRELSQQELIDGCLRADALLSVGNNRLDRTFFEACRHLKAVALHSTGYNRVDVAAATELGIPIGNTPSVTSEAAAEIAFFLMIAVARKAFYHHSLLLAGKWGFFDPTANLGIDLKNKTLGIYGLGTIGEELARRCRAVYNMQVVYCNRRANTQAEQALGAARVDFDALLQQSDVVSVHASLNAQSRGVFNAAAFKKMKPGAIFINTARGPIHQQDDLTAALQQGHIWGAGLDVTDPEPIDPQHPLLSMPTVAVLPHIGSAVMSVRSAMAAIAAENIVAGLKNQRLPHVVNPAVYP